MSETLERFTTYDNTPSDVDERALAAQKQLDVINAPLEPLPGHYLRHGIDIPYNESEQRLREGILDYTMLNRVACGMAWTNDNAGDVAYYAARALGRADSDDAWQMPVVTIRKSAPTLHYIADNPAMEHYGNDEHELLKMVVAMCNLEESWDEGVVS